MVFIKQEDAYPKYISRRLFLLATMHAANRQKKFLFGRLGHRILFHKKVRVRHQPESNDSKHIWSVNISERRSKTFELLRIH